MKTLQIIFEVVSTSLHRGYTLSFAFYPIDKVMTFPYPEIGLQWLLSLKEGQSSLLVSHAPVTIEAEDGDNKKKGKAGINKPEKSFGKKYVNLKLIDFGRSSSTIGGASVIRGNVFLTLLLFESDGFDLIPREDGMKPEKIYKGGSRGAFEHLTNVKEGDVIALLNPKILKPFQVDTSRILNQVKLLLNLYVCCFKQMMGLFLEPLACQLHRPRHLCINAELLMTHSGYGDLNLKMVLSVMVLHMLLVGRLLIHRQCIFRR
jgi:hypothetical protein